MPVGSRADETVSVVVDTVFYRIYVPKLIGGHRRDIDNKVSDRAEKILRPKFGGEIFLPHSEDRHIHSGWSTNSHRCRPGHLTRDIWVSI
jgi:hypothetical protein